MRQIYINILLGVGFLLLIHETSHTASQPGDSMTRGKYIVDHVAMCVECHTPRNGKGEILSGQYLKAEPAYATVQTYAFGRGSSCRLLKVAQALMKRSIFRMAT